jgi:RimJ/RimL family protein N-acetyltransferase
MTIETDRLLLRPFKAEDAADIYEYLKEPTVNCFACMKLHSMSEAEAEIKNRMGDEDFYFAIVIKETGKVIGELFGHPEGTGPEDETMDTFSPCWMLNERFQGKGYAYEAARAYFDYLFNVKNIRRIYAYTEDYNLSSQRLCEKLGMRREGMFMEFVSFVNDEDGVPIYENTMQYAILKKEWILKQ